MPESKPVFKIEGLYTDYARELILVILLNNANDNFLKNYLAKLKIGYRLNTKLGPRKYSHSKEFKTYYTTQVIQLYKDWISMDNLKLSDGMVGRAVRTLPPVGTKGIVNIDNAEAINLAYEDLESGHVKGLVYRMLKSFKDRGILRPGALSKSDIHQEVTLDLFGSYKYYVQNCLDRKEQWFVDSTFPSVLRDSSDEIKRALIDVGKLPETKKYPLADILFMLHFLMGKERGFLFTNFGKKKYAEITGKPADPFTAMHQENFNEDIDNFYKAVKTEYDKLVSEKNAKVNEINREFSAQKNALQLSRTEMLKQLCEQYGRNPEDFKNMVVSALWD